MIAASDIRGAGVLLWLAIALVAVFALFYPRFSTKLRVLLCLVTANGVSLFAFGGLLMSHRLARSRFYHDGVPPSPEWLAGSYATNDIVFAVLPFVILSQVLLTALCISLLQKSTSTY